MGFLTHDRILVVLRSLPPKNVVVNKTQKDDSHLILVQRLV